MAQFIYQMHGLFEVHFFAFIGSAILITYQNWKLQIPIMVFVIIHHLVFAYLQNSGYQQIYFTQLDYFELPVFIIHIFLSGIIFFVCGLWAYQLKRYSEKHISQGIEVVRLQKEAYLSAQLKQNEQRFSSLIQKGADMIAIIDRNSCFKFVSPSFTIMLATTPRTFLSRMAGYLFIPRTLQPPGKIWKRFLQQKKSPYHHTGSDMQTENGAGLKQSLLICSTSRPLTASYATRGILR